MKSNGLLLFASLALISRIAFAGPEDIVGEWRGSSLCTNRQIAPACNDEQNHFIFTMPKRDSRAIHLDAQKLVRGKFETMGQMDLVYSSKDDEWSFVIETPRAKARWSFRVVKGKLDGTLVDQPTGLQIRKVSASRWRK